MNVHIHIQDVKLALPFCSDSEVIFICKKKLSGPTLARLSDLPSLFLLQCNLMLNKRSYRVIEVRIADGEAKYFVHI